MAVRMTSPAGARKLPRRMRAALLIDLDNITIRGGRSLTIPAGRQALNDTLDLAGPVEYVIAVAPHRSLSTWVPELAAAGIAWRQVPTGPDSADRYLTELAEELIANQYTDLWIASCDHYFAALAHHAKLHVVSPLGRPVSRKLARAAVEIRCASDVQTHARLKTA